MLLLKPLNTQLSVFLFVLGFSYPSRKIWTLLSVSDTDFVSVLAAIIRKDSDKRPWMAKALLFIHQPDWVARKASDVSAAGWRYQTHVKNIVFFTCVVTAFPKPGNPWEHCSSYDKINFHTMWSPPMESRHFGCIYSASLPRLKKTGIMQSKVAIHIRSDSIGKKTILSYKLRCYTRISSPEKSRNNIREKIRYFLRVWYRQSASDTSLAFRADHDHDSEMELK